MLAGPRGGAMGSSNAQKLPQPGQGAERSTSGAWHLWTRRVDAHVITTTPSTQLEGQKRR